jgi:epsilon-lactone hydrolase
VTGRRVSPPGPAGVRVPPAVIKFVARQLRRRVLNPELPWPVQRHRLEMFARSSPAPRGTAVEETTLGGVRAEVVSASGAEQGRTAGGLGAASARVATVLHFHGGGYCLGSPRLAKTWAARLSNHANCRVVLPDYRLAPEHPYPAALDDAQDVMKALLAEAAPGSVLVSGDSAGGGLALSLLIAMRDRGEQLPAGCILLSPWLDLSRDLRAVPDLVRRDVLLSPEWLEACAAAYADSASTQDALVSPLRADHRGLPPLLIQAGADELLAPDAAAGVQVTYSRWPRMWHDFALQPGLLAAADSALAQASWFVTAVTGPSA